MYEFAIIWEWLGFAARWLHVVTAIAWIGSSFYFIALDLGLNRTIPGPADGEEWQVHGGGFYHIQKYLVAPDAMPDHLTWFKWESYATWLSGAALLAIVYWAGAELYLIDHAKADLAVWQAILLSAGSLTVGWLAYDMLCKSPLGERPTLLMALLFVVLLAMSWGYHQVFSGRAALLHLGAFTATIMSANVFLVIIPNQKIVVADLRAGRSPVARYGKIAKLRSTHNNYLTLPVIFLMLSNHYPLAFGVHWSWLIAVLVFLMGVTIRHYFNSIHARSRNPTWTWPATVVIFIAIMWLSSLPGPYADNAGQDAVSQAADTDPRTVAFLEADGFEMAQEIVLGRCSMCHMTQPVWEGLSRAPKGVVLDTPLDIARHARDVYLQAAASRAMPPGNVTWMEPSERLVLRDWYAAAVAGETGTDR
ncbi:urate hydroxylase PuuD [Rhodophyticola sp. MJ-SS7]|nr:urate hydroxylase PuuD [Rhodophyticola sp. MJ-SS7]MDU8942214.1 urate hydroxylase PuuD [Rhodophyticola sp. MJ-SS7]